MNSARKLKVVYVTRTTAYDGPERQVLHLVRRLDPRRLEPAVISIAEPGAFAIKLQHAGLAVHTLDLPDGPDRPPAVARLAAFYKLVKLFRAIDPDIVHAFDETGRSLTPLAARIAGVPIIVGSHRSGADAGRTFLWRLSARLVDHLVAPAGFLAAHAVSQLGIHEERVSVIPYGVDFEEVRGRARPDEFAEPRFRVGVLSRLVAGRGIEVAIDAAATLHASQPDVEWLIAGSGPDAMRYLRQSQRLGIADCVRFLGEREDVGALLATVDVVVSPGPRGAPSTALLEAMAAGCACVAIRDAATERVVEDGVSGQLVQAGDAAALASAVGRLLTDPALRARLAAGARAAGGAFGIEAPVVQYHDLYASLVEAARSRGA